MPISPSFPTAGTTPWDIPLNTALDEMVVAINANEAAILGKADTIHVHDAASITSGTLSPARLGTGTADATTFLRGDGAWSGLSTQLDGMIPKVGQYLYPTFSTTAGSGSTNNATGAIRGMGIPVRKGFEADGLIFKPSTGEDGVGVRALIYASDANGHASTLVASGTVTLSGTGSHVATFTPVYLEPGVYWTYLRTNGGTVVRFVGFGSNGGMSSFGGVADGWVDRAPVFSVDVGTYASPTTTLTGHTYGMDTNTTIPMMAIRRSA